MYTPISKSSIQTQNTAPQFSYYESDPPQHTSAQHSLQQPGHERAAQTWAITMAHWSFILLHALMQHMQQKQSASRLQQPLAFCIITDFSGHIL
jgi:hypothetical protein